MIENSNIDDVIDFCFENKVPYIGLALHNYELIYNRNYYKYQNKWVANHEIFMEWKEMYHMYVKERLKDGSLL